ncbi:NADH:ubiquinone reductase (Na(+)-transporting) subunit B [Halosquirtibacter xylanolyticus]|uniref:NADH:ubiquinone reductase (Na(+)-transporting) subunit B n=1 Tax=Halosquirtibacter xylanolyticus TaxID=3374599 RepID=UPI0037482F55|nr:NADH:ubiquinone reductase (Na(+)-transporting) subunit B [Prolixibacteraceae bacterium]
MKALRNWIDKQKPQFEKGGKLHMFKSVFGGFETFLFVPNHTTKIGSHVRDYTDLKRTMSMVVLALIPALLVGMYNIGYQHNLAVGATASFMETFFYGFLRVLPAIIVSYGVGLGVEFVTAQLKGHEIHEGFLVSGLLIPMVMPVNTPLWMIAVSVAFSVVFCKEVFGGTGMNIWNPALVARAFLFFAYPSQMSGESVWVSLGGEKAIDAFSGATPLAKAAEAVTTGTLDLGNFSPMDAFLGFIPGSIGETSTLAILIGAVILIWTGIGSWKIMVSTVLGASFVGILMNLFGSNPYMTDMPFWYHFIIGGFAFGAVFMATDPVSAAQTEKGKWYYGFIIGVLAVIIRVMNPAYPEGMMLAILLMNTFAPLIDHGVVSGNIKRRLKRAKA